MLINSVADAWKQAKMKSKQSKEGSGSIARACGRERDRRKKKWMGPAARHCSNLITVINYGRG
jgi:hypothetical protein